MQEMQEMRDGRTSGPAPGRAAGRRALIGAALASALARALAGGAVPSAGAQQPGTRTRTVLTVPPASGGPCDATVPMRDAAASGDAKRRVTATMRELAVLETASPAGEGPARVAFRRPAGWLGVSTVDVSDLRLTPAGRVVRYCAYPIVVSVEPDSPADRAGLASGDTIVAYAGRDLLRSGEIVLDELLVPGETVRVTVRRDGRTLVKPVLIGQRPVSAIFRSVPLGGPGQQVRIYRTPDGETVVSERFETTLRVRSRPRTAAVTASAPLPPAAPLPPGDHVAPAPPGALPAVPFVMGYGGPSVIVGAQVVAADDDLREALGADARGVAVLKVLPGTPAASAGLRSGDVIVRAGGQEVLTPNALHRAVLRGAEGRALVLRVDRKGKEKDVTLKW
jgi:serine protease Do